MAAIAEHGVHMVGVQPYRLVEQGRQGLILGCSDLSEGRIVEGRPQGMGPGAGGGRYGAAGRPAAGT